MEMINKKHRASYYVQLIKHRYTRPYAIFIWVTIIHDFFRFGMFVLFVLGLNVPVNNFSVMSGRNWHVCNSLLAQINVWKSGSTVNYGQNSFVRQ